MRKALSENILVDATAENDEVIFQPSFTVFIIQLIGIVSAGTGASAITVEGSMDGINFIVIDTMSLTLGTTAVTDHYEVNQPWTYIKIKLGTTSGTDATVNAFIGGR